MLIIAKIQKQLTLLPNVFKVYMIHAIIISVICSCVKLLRIKADSYMKDSIKIVQRKNQYL